MGAKGLQDSHGGRTAAEEGSADLVLHVRRAGSYWSARTALNN